ncbi:MAG TPA: hypothetical protein GXZ91_08635 [Christensenellaceae bacterium]|nr:hypothetical protein [Christensenellaceae bacterium]
MKKIFAILCTLCIAIYATAVPAQEEKYEGPNSMLNLAAKDYPDVPPFYEPLTIQHDLSRLSSTMAYAQLYDMLCNPEQYVGSAVKLKGPYMPYQSEDGEIMHFILVFDMQGCCELSLEMLPTRGANIEYPEMNTEIEVEGLFDICNDNGLRFVALRINRINVVGQN